METKFDIGEEVYLKAKVEKIVIYKDKVITYCIRPNGFAPMEVEEKYIEKENK